MSRARVTRLRGLLLAGSAGVLILSAGGCVRVPEAGPVVVASGSGQASPIEGPYSDPRPPQRGAGPQEIVQGFLDAMTATPVQTNAAAQFLTRTARSDWDPQKLIVYSDISNPSGSSDVSVRLRGADRIGVRGDWRGPLPVPDRLMSFPMTLEGDEWRISRAPNTLIVPQTYFERTYQRAQLYFFDPTARILVPEPTYVPRGRQLVGSLVSGLLRGPNPVLSDVERSFLPPGHALALSVPVTDEGQADIVLKGAGGPLSRHTRQLLLAQLAWTLRQAPEVRSFTLSIGGRPITDASGASVFDVDLGDQYDPRLRLASAPLYAVKHGLLVSGPATGLTSLEGRLGTTPLGIGAFAVSLDGARVAATAGDQLLLGQVAVKAPVTRIAGPPGSRFLRPSWDFAGRLWAVAETPLGAQVSWVRHGRRHSIDVPGVTGERTRKFLVSRDSYRLVAVIRGRKADRIVVSRIAYDASGRPLAATRARQVSWFGGGTPRVQDLGWVSPTSFMVLHLLGQELSEVRTIAVDGSTTEGNATSDPIPGRLIGLATSQVGSQRSYALAAHQLIDLSPDPIAPIPYQQLHHIAYAG